VVGGPELREGFTGFKALFGLGGCSRAISTITRHLSENIVNFFLQTIFGGGQTAPFEPLSPTYPSGLNPP